MQKLYVKTNTAVVVYAAAFALLLVVLAVAGVRGYLASSARPGQIVVDERIKNTSGEIVAISGNAITVRAIDAGAPFVDPKSLAFDETPPPLPTKDVVVYVIGRTKLWKESVGSAEIGSDAEQGEEALAKTPILLGELRIGDQVNVSADVDIRGLAAFDASDVLLLDLAEMPAQ